MKSINNNSNYSINKSNRTDGSSKRKEVIDIRSDLISSQKEIATQLEHKTVDQLMSAHCNDDVNKAVLFVKWFRDNPSIKHKEFNEQYPNYYDKSMYSRMVRYSRLVLENTKLDTIPESAVRKLVSKLDKMQSETKAEILQALIGFVDTTAKLTAKVLKSKIAELLGPYKAKREKPVVFSSRIESELEGKSQEEQIAILYEILSIAQNKMKEIQSNQNPKSDQTETLVDKIQKLLKTEYVDIQDKRNTVKAISSELNMIDGIDNYIGNPMNDNISLAWKLLKGELKATEFANVLTYDDVHHIALKVLESKISSKKREVA